MKNPKAKQSGSKSTKKQKKISDYYSNFLSGGKNDEKKMIDDINHFNPKSEGIKLKEDEENEIELLDEDLQDLSNILNNNSHNYSNNKSKNNTKKSIIKKEKLNEFNEDKNKNKSIEESFLINLSTHSPIIEKRALILMNLGNKREIKLNKIQLTENNFEDKNDFNLSIPYQYCRIINTKNFAYIVGGKINDNNLLGCKYCYQISYNYILDKIKIAKINQTKYEHYSHNLLYLSKFNIIVVCSGHEQKNCEYLCLNKEQINNNKWESLNPLRKSRENALSFLFNENYIFLMGGSSLDNRNKMYEDYDVFDFDSYINYNSQTYWKTYTINNGLNNIDKLIIKQKGCGVVYANNNDIFIIGGCNSQKRLLAWKIEFDIDENNKNNVFFIKDNDNKDYIIKSIKPWEKLINFFEHNYGINYIEHSFCGDQVFMEYYDDYLVNISFGGQPEIIPKSLFKDN